MLAGAAESPAVTLADSVRPRVVLDSVLPHVPGLVRFEIGLVIGFAREDVAR